MSIVFNSKWKNFFLLITMLLFYQSSLIIQSSTHQVTSFEDFKSHQIIFVLFLSASLKKMSCWWLQCFYLKDIHLCVNMYYTCSILIILRLTDFLKVNQPYNDDYVHGKQKQQLTSWIINFLFIWFIKWITNSFCHHFLCLL